MEHEATPPSQVYRGRRLVEFGAALFFLFYFVLTLFDPVGSGLVRWFLTGAMGINGFHFLRRALDPKPRLVLDEAGIWDRTSISGSELFIPWSEVVGPQPTFGQKMVEVEVRDLDQLRQTAGRIRRASLTIRRLRGKKTIPIFLGFLGLNKSDLTEALESGLIAFERTQLGFSRDNPRLSQAEGQEDSGDEGRTQSGEHAS